MVAVSASLKNTYDFACRSAACAPPSAGGTGGSIGRGSKSAGRASRPGPNGGGSVGLPKAVAGRMGLKVQTTDGKSVENVGRGGSGAGSTLIKASKAVDAKVAEPAATGGPTATWAKRAGFPSNATGKGNVVTIKNEDGSVTKVTHAKNSKGMHKFDIKTTKDGYEIHDDSTGYNKGYGGAQGAARAAARQGSSDKTAAVKANEKDYGVRRKDADPNSLQARFKGRQAGVRFPKDLVTNAAGDIIIKSGGGYNPNAGAKLGTMAKQESGKGWQGTLEDGHVVKSKTRAGVIAATVRYIQK